MRRPLVAGNWKQHGSQAQNARLVAALRCGIGAVPGPECIVCPPMPYLETVGRALQESGIGLGAQTVSTEAGGAYTGEVSAAMLRDVGCGAVIVGHSERRGRYGEDDGLVARKFAAGQAGGLVPILCVGESLAERDAGATETVVARQLDAVLGGTVGPGTGVTAFTSAVIAYEPVWAIGTGRTASPAQAQAVHAFIRARIAARDAKIAAAVRIVYGGSVKPGNAAELFAQPDIDGGLIGGASLNADEFLAILAAAAR